MIRKQPWYERFHDWVHDDNNIKGFFGDYHYLSNFHECPVIHEGILYGSSEAAYQAAKTLNLKERLRFVDMSPSKSKREGYLVQLRPDWEDVKVQVMGEIVKDKFTRNEDLKQLLLSTDDKFLEESNWWQDIFWGVCKGKGENWLGRILMAVRTDLKNE